MSFLPIRKFDVDRFLAEYLSDFSNANHVAGPDNSRDDFGNSLRPAVLGFKLVNSLFKPLHVVPTVQLRAFPSPARWQPRGGVWSGLVRGGVG